MKVILTYFSVKEQQLEITIQKPEGPIATPLWLTFADLQYLIHRLREIEGLLFPETTKEVQQCQTK